MKDQNSNIRLMMDGAADAMGAGFARLAFGVLFLSLFALVVLMVMAGFRLIFGFAVEPNWLSVTLDVVTVIGVLAIGGVIWVKGKDLPALLKKRGIEAQARKERAEKAAAAKRRLAARGAYTDPHRNAK